MNQNQRKDWIISTKKDNQMDRNQNRGAEILAFTLGLAMVCYVVAKAFSDYLGVDITAGGRVLLALLMALGMIGYAVWSELTNGFLGFRALLPLAFSTLWSGMWPAMQYWGTKSLYFPGLPSEYQDLEWWANGYTQWGGWALILFGGYGIAYFTWRAR
ncbi:hypothetical protein DND58_28880 [Pseudomonas syringae pv. pisi]|nr:hypothetical protein [Pseudomonas amygdali]MCF5715856.1 hypothetical protein [Pseudomonas tremae]PYD07955.1 hypothetical protein DND62_29360 [Pseudomonas syringae pv. pisi]RMM78188.1 putative Membrane protein [Pseudomonas coronafaciens pv. striafaciens]CZT26266.1 hypothetical protein PCPL58_p4005 [Pseudomonas cerasi]POY47947.1 hypothetical protein BKM09_031755 [Pseudomonas amygdali pv. morsprunorum]